MSHLFSIIAIPFGYMMKVCYMLLKNYGFALILFTFITKVLMFPFSVSQQKQTAKTAKLQPKLEKLKKKYGNNREKLNEEMTKLYAEEGVSMSGGCLPLLLNFVLLFAMIEIIYAPLTYITDAPKADVQKANTLVSNVMTVSNEIKAGGENSNTFEEIVKLNDVEYVIEGNNEKSIEKIAEYFKNDENKKIFKKTRKLDENQLEDVIEVLFENEGQDTYFADKDKVPSGLQSRPELLVFNIVEAGKADFLPSTVVKAANGINYEIFGQFLGNMPRWNNVLVAIPIVSLLLQLLLTFVSQKFTKKNNPNAQMGMSGMNVMLYLMPLLSFWIAFTFPAGVGLYWIAQSIFGLVQTIILNVVFTPEYIEKLNEKEKAKKKGKKSFMERALEAQMQAQNKELPTASDDYEEDEEKKLSKAELKEMQRKRLNEARKRMAEKYGDEYKED